MMKKFKGKGFSKEIMSKMMPGMMESCVGSMAGRDMLECMEEMMPEMCRKMIGRMPKEDRAKAIGMCRKVMDEIEKEG
jgi:hypothetical protein